MSDDFIQEGRTTSLVYWSLGQMMKGAGMAALFILCIGFTLWAIYAVGLLLPEESKQTPSPYGAVTVEATEATV